MPRITRVRIANIQYDNGKKQLPDITIDANGLNTVLLLANGGGKTLLIQLIMQTILPNETMGGRKISDLLLSNKYTGHVAVEWLLDDTGEQRNYLCTGFCFTSGLNNDQGIRYFSYYFDYQDLSGLNIKTLPLINEDERGMKHPTSYVKLKEFFKEEAKNHVQLFEQQKSKYQERLRNYQILPEEWKNIRDTNGSEGGVDKFFEKSKTTQQLVDNLLIPGVEDMVFQSERKKKELVNAFSEYRNMLIEIPLIKKNLKDFEAIKENAEALVEEAQNLNKIQLEYDNKTKEMVVLAKTFAKFKEYAQQQADELEKLKQMQNAQLEEQYWKKESYGVFTQQLEYNDARQKVEEIDMVRGRQEELCRKAEEQEKQTRALQFYNKATEAKREVIEYQTKLDIMDEDQPELQRELQEKKLRLRGAWENKLVLLQKQLREQEDKHDELQDDNKELEIKLSESRAQERNMQNGLANVQAWLNYYNQQQQKVLQHVSRTEVLEPEKALENHTKKLAYLETAEQETNTKIESISNQQEVLDNNILQWKNQKTEVDSLLKSLNNKIEQYEREQEKLCSLLAENELYTKSLLPEKEKVWLWAQDKLHQAQENRVVKQAQLANLEEKWVLLEDKNYYIPHSELLRIKQYLQKKDIYVILGSEWLAEQQLTEEEKKSYLMHQPLLPYTIIIEHNQANAVKYALKQVKDWSRDIPLLFLVKSKESIRRDIMKNEQFLTLKNELLFYQPQSHNIFMSGEALQQYKDEMKQQLAEIKNNVQDLIDEEDKFVQIREQLKNFLQNYNEQLLEEWHTAEVEYRKQIKAWDENIKSGQKQKEELKQQLKYRQQVLKNLQQDIKNEENIIVKLQEYLQDFKLYPLKNAEKQQYQTKLSELNSQIDLMEQQRINNFKLITDIKQSLSERKRLKEAHEKDFRYYQLEEISELVDVAESYEDLKAEVDSVMENMKQKQSDRHYVEELWHKAQEREQDAWLSIEGTGVEEQWLKQNQRWVAADEVKQAESWSTEQRQLYENLKDQLNDARNKADSIKSVLVERVSRIKNAFNREPYLDFSKTDHLLEYNNIVEKVKRLQRELKQLEYSISEAVEWQRENKEAYETIADKFRTEFHIWWQKVESLTEKEWGAYENQPKKVVRQCESDLEDINGRLRRQERLVERKFQDYLLKLESTDNPKIKQFIRGVKVIMDDHRIYDYDFVETQFLRIFEGLDQYQEQYRLTLQEREKNQEILKNLCLRRAITIYDSIMEIQKNSRVNIYQRDIQVIKMDWRALPEQEANEKMHHYLQQVLEDLQKWKQEGLDEDELDRRVEDFLKTRNLIQVIAPIEDCRVTVFKPRKESIVRHHKLDYSPWDEVCRWSGGEEYSIYITMFMIMISHIRQQREGNRKIWKVIVADNPFGRASSPHILETVFQVAKSNRIQLICLTAHKQDSILQRFPVVYSLQLRNAYGKEVMKAEQIETGFYRYDPTADGEVQMAFLM